MTSGLDTPAAGDQPQTRRAVEDEKSWGQQHRYIVRLELGAIKTRRRLREAERLSRERQRRRQDRTYISDEAPFSTPRYPGDTQVIDTVGLALSGGGIRSSAICLGVLQALNHHDLIKRIDYLSTVSGGGYIGSSLTATRTRAGSFVFGNRPRGGPGAERADEISDTPAIGHIRNYSNYLVPAGARDLLTGMAIVLRGLVANFSLTLPVVLLLAAMTVLSNAARSSLYVPNFFGLDVNNERLFAPFLNPSWGVGSFGFALAGVAAAVGVLIVGVIHRLVSEVDRSDFFAYLAGTAFIMGVICNFGRYLPVEHFSLSLAATLLGVGLFFAWALWRSCLPPDRLEEFRSHLPTMGATYLVLVGIIAFFEFQPFMLAEIFDVADASSGEPGGLVVGVGIGWLKSLAALTAPVAAVVTLFRQQFADLLKGGGASDLTSRLLAYGAKAAVWIAGLALPLLIWIGYLYLCYWGIANDKTLPASSRQYEMTEEWGGAGVQPPSAKAAASLSGKIQFDSDKKTLSAELGSKSEEKSQPTKPVGVISHIPDWLFSSACFCEPEVFHWSKMDFGNNVNRPMAGLYIVVAGVLLLISWLLGPNANSLHRLYRDRLSKAFLFNPRYYADGKPTRNQPSLDQGRDFLPLDNEKLSQLLHPTIYPPGTETSPKRLLVSPYHIVNTALNIQGSDFANRRGRNADFFMFSPLWTGSEATGYAPTESLEKVAPDLDLATAMAISGAAASSNMGSYSIRPLTPTLALLNVRLGYWLKNPRYIASKDRPQHHSTPLFLWSEISRRLYENADAVYLTDGGHIENLGVYELLRRRCRVIIAVDAEGDEAMNFSALMKLQRYARIDLGILIDLPWTPIRTRTLELMKCNAGKAAASQAGSVDPNGPHVAIGEIEYGGNEKGYLVYIKSSLSGDENDYIRDYARRSSTFPHETTGDQFFSEEQFEVYRALGFHMTHEFLSGKGDADHVVVNTAQQQCAKKKFSDCSVASIRAVRAALGLAVTVPASSPASPGPDQTT
jgi:hypothetical protein